jgi:mRNA-degrading endonuclease RelE of RelBE toxin-antitoxin system
LALRIQFESTAAKYVGNLDSSTQKRVREKLELIRPDPFNLRLSKPLVNSNKRSARVGMYRLLFVVEGGILLVTDVASRGQVYRNA